MRNLLKNGADYPVRTDGPLITKQTAALNLRGFFANSARNAPFVSSDLLGECKPLGFGALSFSEAV